MLTTGISTLSRRACSSLRSSNARFLRPSRVTSSRVSFSSTQPNNSDTANSSELKFELKKDGKRITGAEFLDSLASSNVIDAEKSVVPKAALEAALTEYDALREENGEWLDKYKRALAEVENVRRRGVKQTEDAKLFAIQSFSKDLLEVADVLDLAVTSVKDEDLKAAGKPMKDLFEGVSMTRTVLMKIFEKHGIVAENPLSQKFDPNLHEAVFQIPKDQAKNDVGHIEHVSKIGYTLKGRPIRAAQVGVVRE